MNKLSDQWIQEFTYPGAQIQQFGGIPNNTSYEYVSSTFLDGLVNYGRNHVAFLLARHGLRKPEAECVGNEDLDYLEPTEENYQAFADAQSAQIHFKAANDDWFILYETDSSYFFLWYDQDCSDCIIERYCRESCVNAGIENFDQFVEERIDLFKTGGSFEFHPRPNNQPVSILVRAANKPRGWISG